MYWGKICLHSLANQNVHDLENLFSTTGAQPGFFLGEAEVMETKSLLKAKLLIVMRIAKETTYFVDKQVTVLMGAIWGHRGGLPPLFQAGGTYYPMSPHFFLFRFCIRRIFKNKNVFHVLCEEIFMLDGRPHIAKLILKQSLVSLILLVYEF